MERVSREADETIRIITIRQDAGVDRGLEPRRGWSAAAQSLLKAAMSVDCTYSSNLAISSSSASVLTCTQRHIETTIVNRLIHTVVGIENWRAIQTRENEFKLVPPSRLRRRTWSAASWCRTLRATASLHTQLQSMEKRKRVLNRRKTTKLEKHTSAPDEAIHCYRANTLLQLRQVGLVVPNHSSTALWSCKLRVSLIWTHQGFTSRMTIDFAASFFSTRDKESRESHQLVRLCGAKRLGLCKFWAQTKQKFAPPHL